MKPDIFDNIEAQIDAVSTPEELTGLRTKALAELTQLQDSLTAQVDKLKPLLISPGSLPKVITWIKDVIAMIEAVVNNSVAELQYVIMRTAKIMDKLSKKADELKAEALK